MWVPNEKDGQYKWNSMKYHEIPMQWQTWINNWIANVNFMWGWTTAITSRSTESHVGRMSYPDILIVFPNLTPTSGTLKATLYKCSSIWGFPKFGVPQNGWFIMENPNYNGWFGGSHFPIPLATDQSPRYNSKTLASLGSSCWARSAAWRAAEDPNSMRAWHRLQTLVNVACKGCFTMKQTYYRIQPHCNVWFEINVAKGMTMCRIKPNAAALQQGANKISESSPAMAGLRLTKSCLAVVPIQLYGLISCISCFLEMPRLEQHKGLVWQTVWHLRT